MSIEEPEFEIEYQQLMRERFRIVCLYIAIPVHILYIGYDALMNPSHVFEFAIARCSMCLFAFALSVLQKNLLSVTIASFILQAGFSWEISLMGYFSEPNVQATYFHNGNLHVLIGALGFLPWRGLPMHILVYLNVASTYFLMRPFAYTPLGYQELVSKICFDIFALLFTYYLNKEFLKTKKGDFLSRQKLAQEVSSREQTIASQVKQISNQQNEINKKNLEAETMRKVSEITFRVAHDIRSPLTALNLAASTISEVNSAQKQLITGATKRITDIAKSLLDEKRRIKTEINSEFQAAIAVEKIVSEKRLIYGNEINIVYIPKGNSLALTVPCDRVRFETTLSNLIQNAIDASSKKGQTVSVIQEREGKSLRITINDKGTGIPNEILSKLGKESVSTKGSAGSGIGVSTAFEFARSNGGRVSIASKEGHGTSVILLLPCSEGPKWLADQIYMGNSRNVVVIDDDKSVHEIWAGRDADFNVEIKSFDSPEEYTSHSSDQQVFLVDYYFSNSSMNGYKYLKDVSPKNGRYLVTSEHENESLRRECEASGIKIIPKSLIPLISITKGS